MTQQDRNSMTQLTLTYIYVSHITIQHREKVFTYRKINICYLLTAIYNNFQGNNARASKSAKIVL